MHAKFTYSAAGVDGVMFIVGKLSFVKAILAKNYKNEFTNCVEVKFERGSDYITLELDAATVRELQSELLDRRIELSDLEIEADAKRKRDEDAIAASGAERSQASDSGVSDTLVI